jgi:DNA-binding XRE family transcriptional regulator
MKRHERAEVSVDEHFRREMADPKFRRTYEAENRKVRLGYVLNKLRNQAGLTQADLAVRVGVTQSYIARLETAEARNYEINTLKKIAAALHKVLVIGFAEAGGARRHVVQRRSVPELLAC